MKTYKVRVTRQVTDLLHVYIEVEAENAEKAEELALEQAEEGDLELSFCDQIDAEGYEAEIYEEDGKPYDAEPEASIRLLTTSELSAKMGA